MVDVKKIQELMKLMNKEGFTRVKLKDGEIEIEKATVAAVVSAPPPPPPLTPKAEAKAAPAAGKTINCPMVGTFYRSPSPEADAFVKAGDTVDANTVVGIVEAMKVMNEVKAGVAGVIGDALIENGQPVEFGTALFRVE